MERQKQIYLKSSKQRLFQLSLIISVCAADMMHYNGSAEILGTSHPIRDDDGDGSLLILNICMQGAVCRAVKRLNNEKCKM